jgi:hypothetical protein
MYGFPTETEQETIDSLEIVRQLFENGLLQSGFWHQFAMTAHSPVGIDPEKYQVKRIGPNFLGFANNDLYHEDPTGADHEKFSFGLKKALYNYMHSSAMDMSLEEFFDFETPKTQIPSKLIANYLKRTTKDSSNIAGYRLIWHKVFVKLGKKTKMGVEVTFTHSRTTLKIEMPEDIAHFFERMAPDLETTSNHPIDMEAFSSLIKLLPEQIIKQEWWIKMRKEFLWVIKG